MMLIIISRAVSFKLRMGNDFLQYFFGFMRFEPMVEKKMTNDSCPN
jgi:hypothetical protein